MTLAVPMSQNMMVICAMKKSYKIEKSYKIYETYLQLVLLGGKVTWWPVICSISAKESSREKHKASPSPPPMIINTGLPE
jgi:hypothetical protein